MEKRLQCRLTISLTAGLVGVDWFNQVKPESVPTPFQFFYPRGHPTHRIESDRARVRLEHKRRRVRIQLCQRSGCRLARRRTTGRRSRGGRIDPQRGLRCSRSSSSSRRRPTFGRVKGRDISEDHASPRGSLGDRVSCGGRLDLKGPSGGGH